MAVADQNVCPPVVVHVEESAAPSQILRVRAQPRSEGRIFESRSAQIMIKRRRVAGEVGFHDVEIAVEIVVRGRNPHTSLRLAVGAERASRLNRDILEFSVLLILVERAGGRIVGDINIGPTVVVEIRGEDAQSVRAVRIENARRFGNIGERTIAVVVIQNVLSARQSRRSARHHHTFIKARTGFRHRRSCQIEINVIGDEQVKTPVAVVVDEGTTRVPARAFRCV